MDLFQNFSEKILAKCYKHLKFTFTELTLD